MASPLGKHLRSDWTQFWVISSSADSLKIYSSRIGLDDLKRSIPASTIHVFDWSAQKRGKEGLRKIVHNFSFFKQPGIEKKMDHFSSSPSNSKFPMTVRLKTLPVYDLILHSCDSVSRAFY